MKEKIKRGLTTKEVEEKLQKYGYNELEKGKKKTIFNRVGEVLKEPMFLLLLVASGIYFLLGEPRDGVIMLIFVVGMITIEVIQECKTGKALEALKELTDPKTRVVRDQSLQIIPSRELVVGDICYLEEGEKIPVDGLILESHDLTIDESMLTGESVPVLKEEFQDTTSQNYFRNDTVYAGTRILGGSAYIETTKTGVNSEFGKISSSLSDNEKVLSPLQKETRKIIHVCAWFSFVVCLLVVLLTFFFSSHGDLGNRVIQSILSGITLAMATIPEEFPVVLTVFLSMGAFRLAKKNALVRTLSSVETLGAVSVLCVDKTGTLTQNKMSLEEIDPYQVEENDLLEIASLACEEEPYDAMEKAIRLKKERNKNQHCFKEYPFTRENKMMGHLYKNGQEVTIAIKGSLENVLTLCDLSEEKKAKILSSAEEKSRKGLRILGVSAMKCSIDQVPDSLLECKTTFLGTLGFLDPPREEIEKEIAKLQQMGIRLIMMTGDHDATAKGIAQQIGMKKIENSMTGAEIDQQTEEELRETVKKTNIFSRMIPEQKRKVVMSLQKNGEVVAMTGDGVNDAPSLLLADIGIAMGQKGSEVARESADLILLDDSFSTIIETIQDGRRIYDNIKRAIGYIFTIHIPIIISSILVPLLHIPTENAMLLPLHIMLLELLIDPTCSIVLERGKLDKNRLKEGPRNKKEAMLNTKLLGKSILTGIVISCFAFGSYYGVLQKTGDVSLARTLGLTILFFANFFLVFVNSSETEYVFEKRKELFQDKVFSIILGIGLLLLIILVYTPLNQVVRLTYLKAPYLLFALFCAFLSTFWLELFKKRKR